jgi:hypothetical protein
MPEAAPAPIENPHLRALEEETMWWLTEGRTAVYQNLSAVILHEERFQEELCAALHYEEQLYERARRIRLESRAAQSSLDAFFHFRDATF